MRRLALSALAVVALAVPATALAERLNSSASIHVSQGQDRIYGVIQAPKHKCENNRRIILRYSPGKASFSPVDETFTDGLGQYEFEIGKEKRGDPFDPGFYRVRAPRKEAGQDVCKAARSRVVEIFGGGG